MFTKKMKSWQFLSLYFLISSVSLSAGIENYFKKAPNKSDAQQQVKNIDFIYMINLDQRPEKYELCKQILAPFNIVPYRFSAVNGWELSLETINDVGIRYNPSTMTTNNWGTYYLVDGDGSPHHEIVQEPNRNYFSHCMARGPIGIVLSHLSVLQDAYDSGYETIWVMEDDIEVVRDPHSLSDMIVSLDNLVGKGNWDILFTDQDTKNQEGKYVPCLAYAWRPNFKPANPYKCLLREDRSELFRTIGARYGAYSMIVRRSGMEKILNFFKEFRIFLPYDMDFTLVPNINFYNIRYDVVSTQPRAISDNGAPNYIKNQ
ncbi:MAG: glycosyltransferase family 25 protein [Candidatus Melainabacteria bacterium]|nr:glycosyltransferase family 25 protein [Candidatus Melainabacteria bacterium]